MYIHCKSGGFMTMTGGVVASVHHEPNSESEYCCKTTKISQYYKIINLVRPGILLTTYFSPFPDPSPHLRGGGQHHKVLYFRLTE